jgi:glyoxylase-like metal-dependent hydrolase (beta-lactamase superfamily II)
MKKLAVSTCFITALVLAPTLSFAKTESVDSIQISENIHLMRVNSSMGNTSSLVSIGNDEVLLIDPNFDGSAELIKQKIKSLGGKKVDYVTSTHVHRDHTEQYPIFLKTAIGVMPTQQRIELAEEAFMQGKLPTITFEGSTTLHLNNDTIKLSTLPTQIGHTTFDSAPFCHQYEGISSVS